MITYQNSYTLWMLLIIHCVVLIEALYFMFLRNRKIKFAQVMPDGYNNKTMASNSSNDNDPEYIYTRFPNNSMKTFCTSIKVTIKQFNHLFLSVFCRTPNRCEGFLQILCQNILVVGILALSGATVNSWSSLNALLTGVLAALIARIFHTCYSSLQKKQNNIELHLNTHNKLVEIVETEVVRRLNIHRRMERVLGYLIMTIYYAASVYYIFKFSLKFSNELIYHWLVSCLIGIATEVGFIEPLKVFFQIEAANYLKNSSSRALEGLSKLIIDEEFLSTFD